MSVDEFGGMNSMMRCDATFKKRIRLECFDALERAGFTRFRKEGVDWSLDNGFYAWIGLNTALEPNRVEILPFVGLHVVQIEKLCSLKGGRYPYKYNRGTATYGINMGSLESIADERAFAFAPQQSDEFIQSECERLAHLYATAGFNYARSIASYEALLPLLQAQGQYLGGYPERVASCLYLMGRKAEAREFIENFPEKYREYIDGFTTPFLELLDQEGVTSAVSGKR
jgi:hypothetical protein